LLNLGTGFSENAESWKELFLGLRQRGMENPLLVVGDGGRGLWAGLRDVYPDSNCQSCWFHKTQDVYKELPKAKHFAATRHLRNIYLSGTKREALVEIKNFEELYGAKYPKAVKTVTSNSEQLLTFYNFPARHWHHIRTTNAIESVFSTLRLRTNKTRGKLAQVQLLALVFKLVEVASKNFRKITGVDQLGLLSQGVKFINGEPEEAKK
jgi:transposase-like protein